METKKEEGKAEEKKAEEGKTPEGEVKNDAPKEEVRKDEPVKPEQPAQNGAAQMPTTPEAPNNNVNGQAQGMNGVAQANNVAPSPVPPPQQPTAGV